MLMFPASRALWIQASLRLLSRRMPRRTLRTAPSTGQSAVRTYLRNGFYRAPPEGTAMTTTSKGRPRCDASLSQFDRAANLLGLDDEARLKVTRELDQTLRRAYECVRDLARRDGLS